MAYTKENIHLGRLGDLGHTGWTQFYNHYTR